MSDNIQQQLDYTIPEYIYFGNKAETIRDLIHQGGVLTTEMIEHYSFLDQKGRCQQLKQLVEECQLELNHNRQVKCQHKFEQGVCSICDMSLDVFQEHCKHIWAPAGAKKNSDRIHNKGNGKGKYQAYKCQKCFYFKRRFLS